MQDRIKAARRALGLTQTEFGAGISVRGNTITGYETGLRHPSDAVIASICRQYQISETWLREGKGEMFVQLSQDEELGRFFGEALSDQDSFRSRFLRALSQLDDDQWAALEQLTKLIK